MKGYNSRDVARLLGLTVAQVRGFARDGFLTPPPRPGRGVRRRLQFSFQDLVILRTAKALVAARIPTRRIRRALKQLRQQLPRGRSLAELRITAEGDRIMVSDGYTAWNPESGQTHRASARVARSDTAKARCVCPDSGFHAVYPSLTMMRSPSAVMRSSARERPRGSCCRSCLSARRIRRVGIRAATSALAVRRMTRSWNENRSRRRTPRPGREGGVKKPSRAKPRTCATVNPSSLATSRELYPFIPY